MKCRNSDVDDAVVANTMNSTTWNGTQTFNYKGDPVDVDNDTDAQIRILDSMLPISGFDGTADRIVQEYGDGIQVKL